jgi:hypothetical protein
MTGMIATKRWRTAGAVLLAAGVMTACSNPVGEGSHIDPDAFEIRSNGTVLVSGTEQAASGPLTLQVGQVVPVTVHFKRQNQELTVPQGYWLAMRFQNGAVPATPTPPAPITWEPLTEGGFSGSIRGIAAGSSPVQVVLMHGPVGSGHDDFRAVVTVTVTAALSQE